MNTDPRIMNMFAANEKGMVFCTRHNLHVVTVRPGIPYTLATLDLLRNLPEACRLNTEKMSTVCCAISNDGKYVAAADSEKNIFLFERQGNNWDLFATWEMDKRVLNILFDKQSSYVVMTDKTGDLYISYMHLKSIHSPTKILGHCSLVLDAVITDDNLQIITCDRDEKIRISKFPGAFEIDTFLLGHKEAVVNMHLVFRDRFIISVSIEGVLKLWNRHDHKCVKTWNVFTICYGTKFTKLADTEVNGMRASTGFDEISHMAFRISGYTEIPVLVMNVVERTCKQLGQVKKPSEFCDVAWMKDFMFVFAPEIPSLQKFILHDHGLLHEAGFKISKLDDVRTDLKEYALFNKNFSILRKRVPSSVMATIERAKDVLVEQLRAPKEVGDQLSKYNTDTEPSNIGSTVSSLRGARSSRHSAVGQRRLPSIGPVIKTDFVGNLSPEVHVHFENTLPLDQVTDDTFNKRSICAVSTALTSQLDLLEPASDLSRENLHLDEHLQAKSKKQIR